MHCPICGEEAAFTRIESHVTDGLRYDMLRCGACDSHFADPLKEISADWYEDRYQRRNYIWRWDFDRLLEDLPSLLPAGKDSRFSLADIGCGAGLLLREIRRRSPSADLTGVDFNRWALAELPGLGIKTVSKDVKELAAEGFGPFDVITFFHLLEHLDDPEGFLRHVRELLAPDGAIVFSVPNRGRWNLPFFGFELKDSPPHHLLRFSRNGLERLLGRAGYKLERFLPQPLRFDEIMNFLSWIIADSLRFGMAKRLGTPKKGMQGPSKISAVPSFKQRMISALIVFKEKIVVPCLTLPYAAWFYAKNFRQLRGAQGHALYVIARRTSP